MSRAEAKKSHRLWIFGRLCHITVFMAGTDMTVGSPTKLLLDYSIPIVLGNMFQLLYNAADSVIAGRFIGKDALAAIGMSTPVTNIIILSVSGICIGSGVIMSHQYGAGRYDMLRKALSTVLCLGVLLSLLILGAGLVLTPVILELMNTPEELLETASSYMRIIFFGVPFTFIFNALSAGLKSVGDSKTPLKFLLFSSVLNLLLDIVFIGILGYGISCSALTTVVAEAVSAGLASLYIYRKVPELRLERKMFVIDMGILSSTLSYGSATALQQSIQPVCKLLIQSAVNALGVDAIAAFNAVSRVDDFAFIPEQSIAAGITTYIAQNEGAGKTERIREGIRRGLMIEAAYGIAIGLAAFLLRKWIPMLFVHAEEAGTRAEAVKYLAVMSFFYVLPAMTNGMQGMFRGVGRMRTTVVATSIQAGLRVVFTYLLVPRIGLAAIPLACAGGWIFMLMFLIPMAAHRFGTRKTTRAPS